MTDTKELIGRLKEQCDRDAAEHCPDEIISLQREAISALEAQAKQIEALGLALETERGAANLYAQQVAHWMFKHDEILKQIEALQADAERYLWLRGKVDWGNEGGHGFWRLKISSGTGGFGADDFDRDLDAAMAAQKGGDV